MVSLTCIAPLFVPADRPERYAKAAASGADAIIIDLEDAVAPDAKDGARAALAGNSLPEDVPVIVRVNAVASKWYDEDIAGITPLRIAGVMLPKAERAETVASLLSRLGGRPVIALIETARGLAAAREIAQIAARDGGQLRLAFGSIDFCAEIGCAHTREALLAARSELVLASALYGLPPPLDGVTTSIEDDTASYEDARHAEQLGFGGKLCIHPRQIGAVRKGFAPTENEILWAQKILAAEAGGATMLDGNMVDAPVRARARRVLARCR